MRAVVQRVTTASVTVDSRVVGRIARGACARVGVGRQDTDADADALAAKVVGLRIFEDPDGKMNLALPDVSGALLAVSQFTLFGDVRKGKRPSFGGAMEPWRARELFERFCAKSRELGVVVETGTFRARMTVDIEGDGPVTLLVDTKRLF